MTDEIISVINLNSVSESKLGIPVDQIPTLTPPNLLNPYISGDSSPYYKYQKINFPLVANGLHYDEEFFHSYIGKASDKLIPGQKYGHSDNPSERARSDFFLVGGLVVSNNDGTGEVFFKNYIPKKADSDNEFFIKELKTNLVEFSLKGNARVSRIEGTDGWMEIHVIESISGERNDAVETDAGAMKQVVNAGDPQKNILGEVMGKELIGKQEALLTVSNLLKNGQTTLMDLAKPADMESFIVTNAHKDAVSKLSEIKTLIGDEDPTVWIKNSIDREVKNSKDSRESLMLKEFGDIKNSEGKDRQSRLMADTLAGKEELTEEFVANIKKNPLYLTIKGQDADVNSEENDLGISNLRKDDKPKPKPKTSVLKY